MSAVRRPARFRDERASARLLFAPELEDGALSEADVDLPAVWAAVSSKPVPTRLSRLLQRRMVDRGTLGYEQTTVPALAGARRAVLGDDATGAPRPLVRLLDGEGHDDARPALASAGVDEPSDHPAVVVATAAELTRRRWPALAERYAVICADRSSVATMGFHHAPLWRRGAVYLPAYLQDAREAAGVLRRMGDEGLALWVPIAVAPSDPGLAELLDVAARLESSWEGLLRAAGLAARAASG